PYQLIARSALVAPVAPLAPEPDRLVPPVPPEKANLERVERANDAFVEGQAPGALAMYSETSSTWGSTATRTSKASRGSRRVMRRSAAHGARGRCRTSKRGRGRLRRASVHVRGQEQEVRQAGQLRRRAVHALQRPQSGPAMGVLRTPTSGMSGVFPPAGRRR